MDMDLLGDAQHPPSGERLEIGGLLAYAPELHCGRVGPWLQVLLMPVCLRSTVPYRCTGMNVTYPVRLLAPGPVTVRSRVPVSRS